MMPAPMRRLLLPLGLSLGAHVALGWALARRPPSVPSWATTHAGPVAPGWLAVEIRSPVAPRATTPPAPATAHAAPRRTPTSPAQAVPRAGPTAHEPPRPAPPTSPAMAQDTPRAAPRLDSDIPRANPPRLDLSVPSRQAPHPDPQLLVVSQNVERGTGGSGPVMELDAGVPPPGAQRVVEDLVAESMGRGRVERGLVDPYFQTLGKTLMKAWDADRAVSRQGLKGFLAEQRDNSRAFGQMWMAHAAAYGATGAPVDGKTLAAAGRHASGEPMHPNLDVDRELRAQWEARFRDIRSAVIRVEQNAEGELLDVRLVSPSHAPEVDREAVKDVRAAARMLPPPPPEALHGRSRIISLWQFELVISISPPVPSFSFEFDEALGFVDPRMPLDRRIYKHVRLLEVR
ncbi:energy transducer TonB [Myxococcaceae bacterium JPH2]|nr:energy transducer TonB [Myxococcaceae bacterium JPH2]